MIANASEQIKHLKTLDKVVDFNDREVIETIKKTVGHELTDSEFFVFLQMCKSTGLNPISREIWAIVTKPKDPTYRKLQLMVGIEGYLRIAHSHPMYDGYELDLMRDSQGLLKQVICKVYRKDRTRPSIGIAIMSEDRGSTSPGSPWTKIPTSMLCKVAKSRALRDAFPNELNGTYTPDEFTHIQVSDQKSNNDGENKVQLLSVEDKKTMRNSVFSERREEERMEDLDEEPTEEDKNNIIIMKGHIQSCGSLSELKSIWGNIPLKIKHLLTVEKDLKKYQLDSAIRNDQGVPQ